ncbi:hypothetical protein VHEMI08155 [[Torrubiella] hemipterigena]|uniref:CID domain-containing protein n=1 Tax=[Torrubiella] hemipterigena TaxID=1531966 RepID=A0A0A1TMP2_9HYPO|nr:hypothetical protein VHEMI08155 [[Torrubiella] hemipterigena]
MASEASEVAEDYRHALEDLTTNARFEISNLTVIARENTEHALAIAEVLQQHILKAPPAKKLPALYVLDSIVKNVGTPYTLFFGRNLFKIFMESYAAVDNQIRKKMEDVLRTWKEPVPGSMDMRPVFSHELVRPIENALMKVRQASMPQQNMMPGRPRPGMPMHRDTPTPPGMQGQPMPGQPFHGGQQPYIRNSPQPYGVAPGPFQPPPGGNHSPPPPPGSSVENLESDIQTLIAATRVEAAHRPHDVTIQGRLRALQDLQGVMRSTNLPYDQLELIRVKVAELASVTIRQPPPQAPSPTPPPASAPVSLDALLGQGALAALMARTGSNSQTSTPPAGVAALRSPPAANMYLPPAPPPAAPPAAAPVSNDAMALLDKLRLAGMLPGAGNVGSQGSTPPPAAMPAMPPSIFPANLASILAKANQNAMAGAPGGGLNSTILKQEFRPDVINRLYDNLGPPCSQCGRRFRTDEEGRKKKTAHMDWHFKVHQRSAEAEKRGTHRSWYVDQEDWLKSREVVDSDHQVAKEEVADDASKAPAGPKYIAVPDPTSGINTVCPICQERFENKWLDTAQEWVWLDAVLVRNRAFHASCLAEASKDRDGGGPRRTPDPVLGKRKAERGYSPKMRQGGRQLRQY